MSILLYACETWTLTSTEWDELEAFHTGSQRRILNIKWSDFITNDELYVPEQALKAPTPSSVAGASVSLGTLLECPLTNA